MESRVVQDVPERTHGMTGEHIYLKYGCTGPRQDMKCKNALQAEMDLLLKVQAFLEQVLLVSVHVTVVCVFVLSAIKKNKRSLIASQILMEVKVTARQSGRLSDENLRSSTWTTDRR